MVLFTLTLAGGLVLYATLDSKLGGWIALISTFAVFAVRFLLPFPGLDGDDFDLDV